MSDHHATVIDGKCSECGADLSRPHALDLSTDGWYSYRGRLDDSGEIVHDVSTLTLSDFTEYDGVTCNGCGREIVALHGSGDAEGEAPQECTRAERQALDVLRVICTRDAEINGGDLVEALDVLCGADPWMGVVLLDEIEAAGRD